MANILDTIIRELTGSPETGRGLIDPQNILDAAKLGAQNIPQAIGPVTGSNPLAIATQAVGNQAVQVPQAIQSLVQQPPQPPQIPDQGQGQISNVPVPPPVPEESPEEAPGDPNKLIEFLKRAGIPLGAAVAGTAFPGILPEAAGLAQGFERTTREVEKESGSDFVTIFDEETGETQELPIRKGSKFRVKRKGKEDFVFSADEAELIKPEGKTGDAVKKAEAKTSGRVIVEKDGVRSTLPREQLEQAVSQGFRLVE